jgi:hypothetical protein
VGRLIGLRLFAAERNSGIRNYKLCNGVARNLRLEGEPPSRPGKFIQIEAREPKMRQNRTTPRHIAALQQYYCTIFVTGYE